MIRVFVLASVRLYREGLQQCLAGQPAIDVTGSAAEPAHALPALLAQPPDVLLLDLGADASLSFARQLRTAVPETKIIGLAVSETAANVIACAESGMSGYLTADATLPDLVATIERAYRGETACPPHLTAILFKQLAIRATVSGPYLTESARLTARETEIVELIIRRLSNKEIARALCISLSTVKNHVHNVLRKLHAERRSDIALLFPAATRRDPGFDRVPSG